VPVQVCRALSYHLLAEYKNAEERRASVLRPATRRRPAPMPRAANMPSALGKPIRVGKEWIARVVRGGRTPIDYEAAYEDLAELLAERGIEIDDVEPGQLVVRSVDTNVGPGIAISVTYRVEDEPDHEVDDDDGVGIQ